MRTHQDIIAAAGGPTKLSKVVGVDANTVKAWRRSNSIPGPYWSIIEDAQIASLRELADASKAPAAKRVA